MSSVEIRERETPCWEKVNKGNQLKREIFPFFVSRHMWQLNLIACCYRVFEAIGLPVSSFLFLLRYHSGIGRLWNFIYLIFCLSLDFSLKMIFLILFARYCLLLMCIAQANGQHCMNVKKNFVVITFRSNHHQGSQISYFNLLLHTHLFALKKFRFLMNFQVLDRRTRGGKFSKCFTSRCSCTFEALEIDFFFW